MAAAQWVAPFFRRPLDDTLGGVERLASRPTAGALWAGVSWAVLGLIATWYVYVPIHELLHAIGCAATGGTVTTLEIQTQYGGELLAHLFPFVVPGGEYAGRLSDFETHGSDLVYLATDALPYLLSIVIGVPLLRLCARETRPFLFGAAVILGLAPFYNIPGDYYEMGSIIATHVAGWLGGSFEGLRSDDVFLLLEQLFTDREQLHLPGDGVTAPLAIIATALGLGVLLAFATYAAGHGLASRLVGPPVERASRDQLAR
jgi:hypothetical protein